MEYSSSKKKLKPMKFNYYLSFRYAAASGLKLFSISWVCVCLTVGYIRTLSPASLWDMLRGRGTWQLPQMLPRWCGWAQRQGDGIPHPHVVSYLSPSLIVRPLNPRVQNPETQPTTEQKSLEKKIQEIPKSFCFQVFLNLLCLEIFDTVLMLSLQLFT